MKATTSLNDTAAKGSKKCWLLGKAARLTSKSADKPNDTPSRMQWFGILQGEVLFRGMDMGRYDYTLDFSKNQRVSDMQERTENLQSYGSAHEIEKKHRETV